MEWCFVGFQTKPDAILLQVSAFFKNVDKTSCNSVIIESNSEKKLE